MRWPETRFARIEQASAASSAELVDIPSYPPPPLCAGTSNVLPCDQQVVLGQCFQAKKCRGTRDWLLRMAMSSPVPQEKSFPGALCRGMYALSFLTVTHMAT